MLQIQAPDQRRPEHKYIVDVLIHQFLGLEYTLSYDNQTTIRINNREHPGSLEIADILLQIPERTWLTAASLPAPPCPQWNLKEVPLPIYKQNDQLPIIYGQQPYYAQESQHIRIGLDIFGSAFYMLTRYEEAVDPTRDNHDRFPSSASLAAKAGFLERPIVNEYLEILRAAIKALWPQTPFKQHQFHINVTHDVDQPFCHAHTGPIRMARSSGSLLLKHQKPLQALTHAQQWFKTKLGARDPLDTFDRIMDYSEKRGHQSAFYFIPQSPDPRDGNYQLQQPQIRKLMRRIAQRGHEIGLHLSYRTYRDPTMSAHEFQLLKRICAEEGIRQDHWGGRQHFLRWRTPQTFRNWNDAGLDYDSTMSYADRTGFRSGTCYEHTTFDLETSQPLKLKERPLTLMECSIIDPQYMGLGTSPPAYDLVTDIKQKCRFYNGQFTLLWHNTRFVDPKETALYLHALDVT